MRIPVPKMPLEVLSMYSKWFEKYRDDFVKGKPVLQARTGGNISFVKKQIKFIGLYLCYMLLDGNHPQNIRRIKRFLSMQKPCDDGSKMELRFIGGNPIEAVVIIEKQNDVDISDVHGITGFEDIYAIKGKNKRWTPQNVKIFIKALKNDIEYDGPKVKFKHSFYKNVLVVGCSIKEN